MDVFPLQPHSWMGHWGSAGLLTNRGWWWESDKTRNQDITSKYKKTKYANTLNIYKNLLWVGNVLQHNTAHSCGEINRSNTFKQQESIPKPISDALTQFAICTLSYMNILKWPCVTTVSFCCFTASAALVRFLGQCLAQGQLNTRKLRKAEYYSFHFPISLFANQAGNLPVANPLFLTSRLQILSCLSVWKWKCVKILIIHLTFRGAHLVRVNILEFKFF